MKIACWAAGLLLLCMCLGWAGEPAAEEPLPLQQEMSGFDRNVALGVALTMRAATAAELEELQSLAERGLKAARGAVAKQPDSPDAHYLLGSWLLYGYRVAEVQHISYDPERGETLESSTQVVQGMADGANEGLAELKRVTELAPTEGDYFLDYAAALADCDRLPEAQGLLKSAWGGKPTLSQEQKMHAGLLLSDISAAQGDLSGARQWIYTALSLDQTAAGAVERLRLLDAAQAAEAAQALLAEAEEEVSEEYGEEEYWGEYWPEEEVESEEELYWE